MAITETRTTATTDAGAAAAGRRLAYAWYKVWPALAFVVAVVALWEIIVVAFDVSSFVISPPSAIAVEMVTAAPLLLEATWITTQEVAWGFVLSVIVGVLLALVIARFRWVDRAVYPLIVLFQVVPKVALAPIFILWFGYSMTPKLVLIVVMAFFPITLNMVLGLKRIDPDFLLLMRSAGSTRNQVLFQVQVPTSLPYLFAGMRIGITLAVIGAVVAEFAGSQNGLGFLIQYASTQLDTALMFAALIVVSVLGLAFYYLISLIEFFAGKRYPHISETAV